MSCNSLGVPTVMFLIHLHFLCPPNERRLYFPDNSNCPQLSRSFLFLVKHLVPAVMLLLFFKLASDQVR